MAQKTALSVQSLACHGKCALTEALPIISACGISLSVLPTALLSTHTGGFGEPERVEITEFLKKSLEHFKKENIRFDGIATGYFSDKIQISTLLENWDSLINENGFVLVDPVLGDKGKIFSGLNEDLAEEMVKLCQKATVITPNLTEAYMLLGENYCQNPSDNAIIDLCLKLYDKTKAQIVITGIERENKILSAVFNGEKLCFVSSKRARGSFHGTGDIFSAVVFALSLRGMNLNRAVKKAMQFIYKSVKNTLLTNGDERNGISFEQLLKNI